MRTWGRILLVDGALTAAWLVAIGAVVLRERGELLGGYSKPLASLVAPIDAKEQWFGIYYQGVKIGFAHTTIQPDEREGVPGISVRDVGQVSFNLLGTPQRLRVLSQGFIDADWRLQEFQTTLRTETYEFEWSGVRHGDEFELTATTPQTTVTTRLSDPTGSAFASGISSWAAFHRLRVGQTGKAWILNPLSLRPETVVFHVARSEEIEGRTVLVVETDISGMTTTSWVTPDGEVVKETSPMGWHLVQEPRAQAMAAHAEGAPTLDLLSTVAVPLDRELPDPATITRLVLLIEGAGPEDLLVERPWQTALPSEQLADYGVAPPESPWCLLRLERPVLRRAPVPIPASVAAYRQPSPFVQSADDRIANAARTIVRDRTDAWEQVSLLNRWVARTVAKQLTIGLPSALDVLAAPVGDCHEHTVLFTALARSLGIPTRMVAGLVYQYGRLYYHAWPEVWVQGWVPVDPTLGQVIADATHVGLLEAENQSLVALGQFVGQLSARVLEVQ